MYKDILELVTIAAQKKNLKESTIHSYRQSLIHFSTQLIDILSITVGAGFKDEIQAVFPNEIRRIMYTTNIIERLNRQYRKVTKIKSVFPSNTSLEKILLLEIKFDNLKRHEILHI